MKKIILVILLIAASQLTLKAGNGDSIFNMQYVHTLHITFPYPAFYDSLLNTNTTDQYLNVAIDFNGELFSDIGIKVKGNSSFTNPSQKKSFKLDFNVFIPGQDIHGLKKLNFNNLFKDPSFMREKLANDFLIDHDIPAPRTTYCNVYMNGQLWGLYAILEEVDDEFCKDWFDNNDGNLFKGDPHGDLKWKGSATQSLYETEYELKNNSTANNWSDLISMIDVINNTAAANLYPALEAKLETKGFVKQWAALNMFSSLDSYIGSGHNYYVYHDTLSNQFRWISWDNNETFGSFKIGLSSTQLLDLDMYYLSNPTSKPLCNNMLSNPFYKTMYNSAYCELKQDFNNAYFDPKIDSIKNKIQASVYADPKKFYTNTNFDQNIVSDVTLTGPGGLTVFGLKSFISTREAAINTSFINNSVLCWPTSVPQISKEEPIQFFPNPVNERLTIISDMPINELTLTDMAGKIIFSKKGYGHSIEMISLANLSSGCYLLQINHGKGYKISR